LSEGLKIMTHRFFGMALGAFAVAAAGTASAQQFTTYTMPGADMGFQSGTASASEVTGPTTVYTPSPQGQWIPAQGGDCRTTVYPSANGQPSLSYNFVAGREPGASQSQSWTERWLGPNTWRQHTDNANPNSIGNRLVMRGLSSTGQFGNDVGQVWGASRQSRCITGSTESFERGVGNVASSAARDAVGRAVDRSLPRTTNGYLWDRVF
jgi:hypothetical protein